MPRSLPLHVLEQDQEIESEALSRERVNLKVVLVERVPNVACVVEQGWPIFDGDDRGVLNMKKRNFLPISYCPSKLGEARFARSYHCGLVLVRFGEFFCETCGRSIFFFCFFGGR